MPPEDEKKVVNTSVPAPEQMVNVPQKQLTEVLTRMSEMERELEDAKAKAAGIEELFDANKGVLDGDAKGKLRERKSFEPAFRTVRLRKYPIAGDVENMGIITGWSNRGAYQKVDKSGVSAVLVDYLDVFFLDKERDGNGKLQAEAIPLLDILNKGEQIHCKILHVDKNNRKEPTGEEISINVFDPQHGLVATGDVIDGYVGYTDITYTVQVPGRTEPLTIDSKYVN